MSKWSVSVLIVICLLLFGSEIGSGTGRNSGSDTEDRIDSSVTYKAEHAILNQQADLFSQNYQTRDAVNENQDAFIADLLKPVEIDLREINGVSLYDDRLSVVNKKGVPLDIVRDPLFNEIEIYRYPDVEISFYGETVYDLSLMKEAGAFEIDGYLVEWSPESIRWVLGEPDYVAEDGLVYQREENLLKVYLDLELHEIVAIRYYGLSNT